MTARCSTFSLVNDRFKYVYPLFSKQHPFHRSRQRVAQKNDEDNEWESGDEGSESVWEGEEHEAELEPEDTSDAEESDHD